MNETQPDEQPDKTIHASAVCLPQGGVLLLGPSASGKSALAYRLCQHFGGQLVADDRAHLAVRDGQIEAAAPPRLRGLLELRGLGLVRVPYKKTGIMDLAVQLVGRDDVPRLPEPAHFNHTGLNVPQLALHAFDMMTADIIVLALTSLARDGFAEDAIYTPI